MDEKVFIKKSKKRCVIALIISVLVSIGSFAIVAAYNLYDAETIIESVTKDLIGNTYRSKYESSVVTIIDTITFSDGHNVSLERNINFKRSDDNDAIRTHVFKYEVNVSALGKVTVVLIPADSEPWEPDEIAYDSIGVARIGDSFVIQNRTISGTVKEQSSIVGTLWLVILISGIICVIAFFTDFLAKVANVKKKEKDAKRKIIEAEQKQLAVQATEKARAREAEIKASWDLFATTYGFQAKEAIHVDSKMMWIEKNILYLSEMYSDYVKSPDHLFGDETSIRPVRYTAIIADNIQYYAKEGDVQYTTKITGGGGGGFSIAGAIVGGIIAGDTGAIIGSRKKVNDVATETEEHDSRRTVIRYYVEDSIETMSFDGFAAYDYLLKKLPQKDLLTIQLKQTSDVQKNPVTIKDKLKTLKALHEEGLISISDYEEQKAKLLQQL